MEQDRGSLITLEEKVDWHEQFKAEIDEMGFNLHSSNRYQDEYIPVAIEIIESGGTLGDVADIMGMNLYTLQRWFKWGRGGEQKYMRWAIEVGEAIAGVKSHLLKTWKGHAIRDWKAARDLLKRHEMQTDLNRKSHEGRLRLRKFAAEAKIAELEAEDRAAKAAGVSVLGRVLDRFEELQDKQPQRLTMRDVTPEERNESYEERAEDG